MEYIKLGRTDLTVSRLCLGCMGFGDAKNGQHSWTVGAEQTEEIIRTSLNNGINFFDTAAVYQNGTSEEYVGRALKKLIKRQDVVLATKFLPPNHTQGLMEIKEYVLSSLDNSLRRLETDYVDLYILHMWDYHNSIEDIMECLNQTVVSGKARYIGISNCFAWQLQKANDYAQAKGYAKFVSVQNHYNLLFREEEREMFGCCRTNGIAMTPYSPLASGRLVKPYGESSKRLEEDTYAKFKYDNTALQDKTIIDRVACLAREKALTTTQIAIAWLLEKVAAPIIGATKSSHIEQAAEGVGVSLTQEDLNYLQEPYMPHKLVGVMATNKDIHQ